jgi:hypothetical protein
MWERLTDTLFSREFWRWTGAVAFTLVALYCGWLALSGEGSKWWTGVAMFGAFASMLAIDW